MIWEEDLSSAGSMKFEVNFLIIQLFDSGKVMCQTLEGINLFRITISSENNSDAEFI